MKALINANIYDFESYKENQYILYDTEIEEVGDMADFEEADYIFDVKCSLIIPGLVVGHTHIYSTFARGLNLPFNPTNFKELLEQLWWKIDAKLDNEAVYHSGLVSGLEYIKNGVTTIIDHHASGKDIIGSLSQLKASVCDDIGLRGVFCFETSDRFDIDKCIKENVEFSKNNSQECAGMFGIHASMSVSDKTLEKIANNIGDLNIHVHTAESIEDEEDSQKQYNKRVINRLDDFGLIKEGSILAHCIHINDEEAEIIKKNKGYIAVNPTSNMNNGVGFPSYELFKKHGIDVVVGNDGLGCNITRELLNMLFGSKLKANNPVGFGFDDLLKIINNNYDLVNDLLGIKVGKIKKGYKADLISLPYNPPTVMNEDNALGHLVFGLFDNFSPNDVICDGEFLMRNKIINADTDNIYAKSREVSSKLWKEL